MSSKPVLSKSTFIKGLQCDKSLYLYKHHYNWQDKVSEMQQSVFDRGHRVGTLAQSMFPGGLDASYPGSSFVSERSVEAKSSPWGPKSYKKNLDNTQKLIEEGKKVLYEVAFVYNEVLVYADIIVKKGKKWQVYEVKSSTSISETYLNDISVQYYVMSNAGLQVGDISIIYINTDYVRQGELDISQLFNIESVKDLAIAKQGFVQGEVERLKAVVARRGIPKVDIGMHCYDPYQCSFLGHCWKHIPENSVFDINSMHLSKKFELYEQGIISFEDIQGNITLPEKQQMQVDSQLSGQVKIDKPAIKEFLQTFEYPLYFMDFESFQPAIPLYDNSNPYQQIPFQYSLHYQKSKRSKLEHKEFLAQAGPEPRIPFIESLLLDTQSPGQIIVYNRSFEVMILNAIANDFPAYKNDIQERISRVIDLMIPFQKKWYYTPDMRGSYSIKSVLPALVPELSYENLDIADGGSASIAYESLFNEKDMFKIEETRKNLLEYCKLDTFAMVVIFKNCNTIGKKLRYIHCISNNKKNTWYVKQI